MTEPMFTKGPWALGEAPYVHDVFASDGFSVADASTIACIHRDFYAGAMGDGHWATTPGSHIRRADGELAANAALIAAAPDLFEALSEAREQVAILQSRLGISDSGSGTLSIIDAALAKSLNTSSEKDAG